MSIPLVPLSIGEATAGSIDISDLTTQSLTGTGVFDILMAAVSLHVNQEFNKGRITGKITLLFILAQYLLYYKHLLHISLLVKR